LHLLLLTPFFVSYQKHLRITFHHHKVLSFFPRACRYNAIAHAVLYLRAANKKKGAACDLPLLIPVLSMPRKFRQTLLFQILLSGLTDHNRCCVPERRVYSYLPSWPAALLHPLPVWQARRQRVVWPPPRAWQALLPWRAHPP
jgi:hypothetical protein